VNPSRRTRPDLPPGFTLVELLVATVILAFILMIIFSIVSQTGSLWKSTSAKITAFQNARAAFEAVTRNLSQATLNHYYDYYDSGWKHTTATATNAVPAHYGRYSELQYVSGPAATLFSSPGGKVSHAAFFQAPLGKTDNTNLVVESPNMLNALGYFVEFGGRSQYEQIPKFLQGRAESDRKGFQLIEWIQPAEKLAIYDKAHLGGQPWAWFLNAIPTGEYCRVMADNIVALIILPKKNSDNLSLSSSYFYDSSTTNYIADRSHLLPPLLQVTLVAIDEDSARRLREVHGDSQPPLIPAGAFQNIQSYDQDIKALEETLQGANGGPRLNYRIFSTTVSTREGE
jgi:uncharacterized protein (TIGR02599 family)